MTEDRIYERWHRWTAIVLASPGSSRWWARTKKLYRDDVIESLEELQGTVPAPHSFLRESEPSRPTPRL